MRQEFVPEAEILRIASVELGGFLENGFVDVRVGGGELRKLCILADWAWSMLGGSEGCEASFCVGGGVSR